MAIVRLLFNAEHIYLPRVATKDEAGVIFEVQINHRKDFFIAKRAQTHGGNRRDELEVLQHVPKVDAAIKSGCYQSLFITGEKHSGGSVSLSVFLALWLHHRYVFLQNQIPHLDREILSCRQ